MFRFVLCLSVFLVLVGSARGDVTYTATEDSLHIMVDSARGDVTAADADFDGSGVVDVADFLQFVNAFGSSADDDNFNAKYDLDGSGTVDVADFLAFVDVFGQTVQAVDSEEDRPALVALYNATGGDNWKYNTNWLSDELDSANGCGVRLTNSHKDGW